MNNSVDINELQPLRIAVDVNTLCDGKSGIQIYIQGLLNQLQNIDKKNEYYLFETRKSSFHIFNPKWKKIWLPTFLPGIVWMQFVLPFHLFKNKINILWS